MRRAIASFFAAWCALAVLCAAGAPVWIGFLAAAAAAAFVAGAWAGDCNG